MNGTRGWIAASVLAFAVALGVAGCGDDSGDDGPKVAATTGILADVTEQIAGDDIEVMQIIPDASSPHDFQLSAKDRQAIEESLLLVHNGAGLEAGVPADELDVEEFALTEHVGGLRPFGGEHEAEHAEEEHAAEEEDENEGGDDPHLWMDPTKVAAAVPALADALAEADPEHAEDYRQRAQAYASTLGALDGEIKRTLAAIPAADRELVTSHDAVGYFADRYDLEVVATPFPASGPEAEASAATINEVEEAVRAADVPAVFAQADDDAKLLELIADETGVEIVDGLHVEAPVGDETYDEMLLRDAQLIAEGLGAGGGSGG